ncbi:MAG: hypothetical protein VX815_03775 [Gemmatimonadota bacterium]|jgi:hypothetical protein|nr:hypothetical protein [Gemmatimonadota bacterium]
MHTLFSVLVTALMLLPALSLAQEAAPTSATDITAAQIRTVFESMGESIDRQLKVVDIGGENVGVGILHRDGDNDTDGEHRGIIHAQVTEVYIILSGGGTLLTGGEILEATEPSAGSILIGPTFSGQSRNGVVREISEGDVVVIPAGVLHAWTLIPDEVTYLSVRVDPDLVLPAGYVNPEIR